MRKGRKRPDTTLVDGGRRREWRGQLVNVPVNRASTILFDSVEQLEAASPPRLGKGSYGLQGTATHWSLSEALTGIEPGAAGTALDAKIEALTQAIRANPKDKVRARVTDCGCCADVVLHC